MSIVNWDTWLPKVPPELVYDPPRLRPSYWGGSCFTRCNYFAPRAICCSPCRDCCACCCCRESLSLTDPDEAFKKLLAIDHPMCPQSLKGIYWMQDNIAAETLVTFQDGDWSSPTSGMKVGATNWTGHYTLSGFQKLNFTFPMPMQMSPDGKWMALKTGVIRLFTYIVQPGDVIIQRWATSSSRIR
jgi:hypothetical protein